MRKLLKLLICCCLASCNFFESKEKKTQELVDQEMQEIDWNDVDQYPLFSDCDETADKEVQKNCFQETLMLHFEMTFQEFNVLLDQQIKDTVYVDFILESNGTIFVQQIHNKQILKGQMKELGEKVTESLNSLPKIEPAIKRGVPVSTKYRIPIILNSN
ncbi:MAG: hypothetical protein AAFZ89_04570 [Bacteroidota bacterium]